MVMGFLKERPWMSSPMQKFYQISPIFTNGVKNTNSLYFVAKFYKNNTPQKCIISPNSGVLNLFNFVAHGGF